MIQDMAYQADSSRYRHFDYVRCGRRGLLLPPLSLGLWHNFGTGTDAEVSRQMILTAFDAGITHFDLANNYGPPPGSAEECFGRILSSDLLPYRDEIIISTKASHLMWDGPYGEWGSRKHMLASLDQSLKRMGLDYVDIFYAHRYDPDTPVEETMGALISAIRSGKALYAGISKYPDYAARTACRILEEAGVPCLLHQFRYNMFDREAETAQFPVIRQEQMGGIVFSPLAQGLLTNKYLQGIPSDSRAGGSSVFLTEDRVREKLPQIRQLAKIADNRGQDLAQMAISWVLRCPEVTSCIIGASRPEQITDCLKALNNNSWSQEELDSIDSISKLPEK